MATASSTDSYLHCSCDLSLLPVLSVTFAARFLVDNCGAMLSLCMHRQYVHLGSMFVHSLLKLKTD